MLTRLRQALTAYRRALTEKETLLEKRAHRELLAAMNRPTVTLRMETEFLVTGMLLQLTRMQKRLLQRLLTPRSKPKAMAKPRSRKTR